MCGLITSHAESIPEIFRPLKDRQARIGLIGDNLLPMNLFALFRERFRRQPSLRSTAC